MVKNGNIRLVGLVAVVAVFVFVVMSADVENGIQFSVSGYSSAFQGPKAKFLGVKYNGLTYTAANGQGGSAHTFDTTMNWDPDGQSSGKPNINGEMTAIFLPQNSLSYIPPWIPISWLQNNGLVTNPMVGPGGVNPPYKWNITETDGTTNTYLMEMYDMRYYVSLGASWSGTQKDEGSVNPNDYSAGEAPNLTPLQCLTGVHKANVFLDADVWLEFDITPSWYIQGGGTAYFAIAELSLAENVEMSSKDSNGVKYSARTDEVVTPESRQSIISLYYGQFGQAVSQLGNPHQYLGKDLNPQYFTNRLYAHVDLNNFGVQTNPKDGISERVQGDIATFAFDLKVFVIGEYKVQDVQQNPDQYGRYTPVETSFENWFTGIVGWLSNPANASLVVIVIAFALILIFAPWLIIAVLAMFKK